jgi:hypothetical protein
MIRDTIYLDVVAVFLHFPNFGRCRVIVAKYDTTLEDAKHMARILGLCYKYTANDYPNLEDFITSGRRAGDSAFKLERLGGGGME